MEGTAWFKALVAGTHYRIWRNHLRWFKPMPGVNDDGKGSRQHPHG